VKNESGKASEKDVKKVKSEKSHPFYFTAFTPPPLSEERKKTASILTLQWKYRGAHFTQKRIK